MADRKATTTSALPPRPHSRRDFRLAIICALPLEAEMVELVLDVDWTEHSGIKYGKASGDKNTYTTGAIAGHNVVLAYMPGIGSNDIAAVAARLQSSFTSVELVFVVGICGAVPIHPMTQEEIVLGDCIISTAVVQYDFGRLGPQGFERKRGLDSLGRASPEIRAMTAKWTTRRNQRYLIDKLQQHLKDLLKDEPSIRYPGTECDLLFQPSYIHEHRPNAETCSKCQVEIGICNMDCELLGCDRAHLIERKRPHGTQPRIHFGCFGSANTVLKSGLHRDTISNSDEIVGFEMEGSGVWDVLPTVVIKSVCDYADSHKSKLWQEYAAATAAACLKAVLERVELSDTDIRPFDSYVSMYQPTTMLDEKESKCLQAFCLQPSYQDAKDRIPERVQGTCQWALSQEIYQRWIATPGQCLLISADPGCGKSVLARHLIDHELKESFENKHICYYFFKDQIQDKLAPALCAILHQLLSTERDLLTTHALPKYQSFGESITSNLSVLSDLIYNTIKDSRSRILIVLDGLDECEEADCRRLFTLLSRLKGLANLNTLMTSRPYDMIISEYNEEAISSRLHIPGEQESDAISKEVNLVIEHRLKDLYSRKRLSLQLRQELERKLLSESHRTYLWVYLVFDELSKGLKKTQQEMLIFFKSLPRTVNEAYEKILNRNTGDDATKDIVTRVLAMMIAAEQPLTTRQMQVAVKIQLQVSMSRLTDIDMEPDEDFAIKLRNYCGLFIQIYNDKVTFIHQTAREFLLVHTTLYDPMDTPRTLWHGKFTFECSHRLSAWICLAYLLLCGQESDLGWLGTYKFTTYAARQWDTHFTKGNCMHDETLCKAVFFILDPNHNASHVWRLYREGGSLGASTWKPNQCICTEPSPNLVLAASLWTDDFLRLCLSNQIWSQTDVCAAIGVASKHYPISTLALLLEHGANPNAEERNGFTPLHLAITNVWTSSSDKIVRYLLQNHADIEAQDHFGRTPLILAVCYRRLTITQSLSSNNADVCAQDNYGRTSLHYTVEKQEFDFLDECGYAYASNWRETVVHTLLRHGHHKHEKDINGHTALHYAICYNDRASETIRLLVLYGFDLNDLDKKHWTPLHWVVFRGIDSDITTLLELGADPNVQDDQGRTPLHYASWLMQEEVVQLLLNCGADPTLEDNDGVSSEQVMLVMSRALVYGRVRNKIKSRKSISDFKSQHLSTAKGNSQALLAKRLRRKSI